jgi:hypothetical protein
MLTPSCSVWSCLDSGRKFAFSIPPTFPLESSRALSTFIAVFALLAFAVLMPACPARKHHGTDSQFPADIQLPRFVRQWCSLKLIVSQGGRSANSHEVLTVC